MADLPFKTHLFPTTPASGLEFSGTNTLLFSHIHGHGPSYFHVHANAIIFMKIINTRKPRLLDNAGIPEANFSTDDQRLSDSSYKDLLTAYEVETPVSSV